MQNQTDKFIITDITKNGMCPVKQYTENGLNSVYMLAYIVDKCNQNCPYCYNQMPRCFKELDLDVLYNFVVGLRNTRAKNKALNVALIGGEPTLHPKMLDFCEKVYELDKDIQVDIFTNFSQPLEYYEKILKLNSWIAATWHSKSNDIRNREYVEKMKRLPKEYIEKSLVEVRIMMGKHNWEVAKETFLELLPIFRGNIDISLLTDGGGPPMDYSEEQLSEFRELIELTRKDREYFIMEYEDGSKKSFSISDIFLNPQVNFYLWKCMAGLDNLYIHVDGNVYPCQSYMEHHFTPFYNINKYNGEYLADKFKSCICHADFCSCDFDIYKERILNYNANYQHHSSDMVG